MKAVLRVLARLAGGLAALAVALPAAAQMVLSNEDTDLFLVNPTASPARPNILILLDNTANWNQAFANEKGALSSFVRSLSDQYNVGLMMFPETGNPNDSVDGGYVRFAVRQMSGANRSRLADLIDAFDKLGDKGNNATFSLLMYEAYAYFAGIDARSGSGKVKRDYAGNASANAYAHDLPGNAFASSSSRRYVSPIVDGCQKNFIVLISNGPASDNSSSLAAAQSLLSGLLGVSPPPTIALNPNGSQNNWTDEYARFMANGDCNPAIAGTQSVYTYTVEVDPGSRNQDLAHTALMKSAATSGKGRYFAVTSADGGAQIRVALEEIFQEALAVNSVFAATTLPVSVNVRGANANQVYMGVFRSDASKAPRWFGNLKLYQLAVNSNVSPPDLYLADVSGAAAESSATGFIVPTARSFWTQPSTFWSFRTTFDTSDAGRHSDSPDGPIVEKGGVAQHLRGAAPGDRSLYTCTGTCAAGLGGVGVYSPGSLLSATPFSTANGDVTAAALGVASDRRDEIIDWARGRDLDDENADGSTTDMRASVHGDVLHSQPAVINFNRAGLNDENDVFVFYGANDGVFRAVKGGNSTGAGAEVWGFVAPEHFRQLVRLRDNGPAIGPGTAKKPYFFDGSIATYTHDANGDGRLVKADGDKVLLFMAMRRGGRKLYALDVSDPVNPRLLWRKGCPNATGSAGCDTGYEELGQTWSEPKVAFLRAYGNRPVLAFGAGYDPDVEDIQPCLVTESTSAGVTTVTGAAVTHTTSGCSYTGGTTTTVSRTMGRGVFVVDAYSGEVLWRAGPDTAASRTVPGMVYAIAADVTVLNRDRDLGRAVTGRENVIGGYSDRIYAVDTGGNVWRLDVDDADPANWKVTHFASIAAATTAADRRKFLYAADVVYGRDAAGAYDAVLIGSGDREHPFDQTVAHRFYMFKDRKTGLDATGQATAIETDLYDATANCLQQCTGADLTAAQSSLLGARGWYIRLAAGEDVVSGATTLSGTVFFNTHTPTDNYCAASLGIAREYAVSYRDGTAVRDLAIGSGLNAADRAAVNNSGGLLPTPVPVIVRLNDKDMQGVISGPSVREGNPLPLGTRLRTFWSRLID